MPEVSELQKLEYQLTANKELAAKRDAALRLADNRDFRKLILDGFCKDDCARYAMESGDPAIPEENRADALAMAQAAGHLKRWLSFKIQLGASAAGDIGRLEEAIAEVRAEEAHS